jgi:hypothetical protein
MSTDFAIEACTREVLGNHADFTQVTQKSVRLEVERALKLKVNALKPRKAVINTVIRQALESRQSSTAPAHEALAPAAAPSSGADVGVDRAAKRPRVASDACACHVNAELRTQLLVMCGIDPTRPLDRNENRALKLRTEALKLKRVAALTEDRNENAMLLLQSDLKMFERGSLVQQDDAKGARVIYRDAAASFTAQARDCALRGQHGYATLKCVERADTGIHHAPAVACQAPIARSPAAPPRLASTLALSLAAASPEPPRRERARSTSTRLGSPRGASS